MTPTIHILKNNLLEVHVSTWGATITKMIVADQNGHPTDVILGLEQAEDYASQEYMASGAYLGAAIGRYANRINKGKFILDGQEYQLATNNGSNHLHGGNCGFDKKIWTVSEAGEDKLCMHYTSPEGEENYPGILETEITFTVTGRELRIDYLAQTTQACPVNLTHHPYFNLNPEAADIKAHLLTLHTDRYLGTNDLIPDGSYLPASGDYDFSTPTPLRHVIERHGGLDDCFTFANDGNLKRMAELRDTASGITLYVCSDYPGLQVYTGRFLDVKGGKGGKHYGAYAGIALEAQYFPDTPNHPEFPSALLKPDEIYRKTTIYGFEL